MQRDIIVAEEEINILKFKIAEQLQAEEIFQIQKREGQRNYDSIYQSIKSTDLATKSGL